MSESKKSTDRKWGGKTAIGDAAAKKAFDEGYGKLEKEELSNRISNARDEADSEVQRETTRGTRPQAFKKGGTVKKSSKTMASRRGDGIAVRGKTKGGIRG